MENPKNQLATKLKEANNVLVTVSNSPSVDQLAAAIGLTLFLTKLKKHATTVFSGQIPSTIDFLKPEESIEDNTNSLRDFIISLDKAKADKIRYKVEDTMVKIFITPYRTSIGEQDLVFSQGDFNVDVVVGIGIHQREDIDQAIMAHGRILHDATVATVNTKEGSELGTLNWTDAKASSLSEMMVTVTDLLKANSLDAQIATAFLTGIVAETERFSNEKTSSTTMNASAKLMAAGANQQLVATKLEDTPPSPEPPASPSDGSQGPEGGGHVGGENGAHDEVGDDGALRIDHTAPTPPAPSPDPNAPSDSLPAPVAEDDYTPPPPPPPIDQIKIDDSGELHPEEPKIPEIKQESRHFLDEAPIAPQGENMFGLSPDNEDKKEKHPGDELGSTKLVTEPPQFGGQLSAAANDASDDPSALNLPPVDTPLLSHDTGKHNDSPPPSGPEPHDIFATPPKTAEPVTAQPPNLPRAAEPAAPALPSPVPPQPQTGQPFVDYGSKTLGDIEQTVDSTHIKAPSEEPEQPSEDYHHEATAQIARAMSDKTLDAIEEKVDSPHVKQHQDTAEPKLPESFAKSLDATRLADLEEKVDSPHLKQATETEEPAGLPEDKAVLDDEPEDIPVLPVGAPGTSFPPVADDSTQDDAKDTTDEPEEKKETPGVVEAPGATPPVSALQYESIGSEPADDAGDKKEDTPDAEEPKPADDKKPDETAVTAPAEEPKPEEPTQPADAATPGEKPDESSARDAVMQAINAGGDTQPLPPIAGLGTNGLMDVSHDATAPAEAAPAVPPPLPMTSEPSPNIHIDQEGTLSAAPVEPPSLKDIMNDDSMPQDQTAAPGAQIGSAPDVPPPMLPPSS